MHRSFELTKSFLSSYQDKKPKFGPLGYITYKRTYARELENGKIEEWWQTLQRVVEGTYSVQKDYCNHIGFRWDQYKAQKSAQKMFKLMWDFKFLPPGRGLWMMGTDYVKNKGGAALNNCAFTSTEDIDIDFASPFTFLMDMSMLGVGVGGDTKGADKVTIKTPKRSTEHYVVEDSREGWCDLIERVLNSYVNRSPYPDNIDYSEIRAEGVPLKKFGGRSGGAQPLIDLVDNLNNLLMPLAEEETRISSTTIVDIFNYIGKAVVSGGIRRTAEIMFGEYEDEEFLNLKLDSEALMDRRWCSNNSIFAEVGMDYTEVAKRTAVNGEPGYFWLENARAYSRMIDPPDWKDKDIAGTNPCSEQSLCNQEICCLVETFPSNHDTLEEYLETLKYAYRYAKTVTLIPTHNPRTNAIVMRNRRIGASQTGITASIKKLGIREHLRWCDEGYKKIDEIDDEFSDWLGIPRSKKMTSVKPSGTLSLLPGVPPGIHYPHSEYYIRRIRISRTSPIITACEKAGYFVEDAKEDASAKIVGIPVKEDNYLKGKNDVSMWEQLELAAQMQAYWADNQVSVTITFKPEEAKDIPVALSLYETRLKSVSFLPILDHGYIQAPYEEITKERYEEMHSKITELIIEDSTNEVQDEFCDGELCEVEF